MKPRINLTPNTRLRQLGRDINNLERAPIKAEVVVVQKPAKKHKKPIGATNEIESTCTPSVIYVVENNDVFKSDGATLDYSILNDPSIASFNAAYCAKAYQDKLFYITSASGSQRVVRSIDGGLSLIIGGAAPDSGAIVHFDIAADGTLFALVNPAGAPFVARSDDDGDTWTKILDGLGFFTANCSIACHPTDANRAAFIEMDGDTREGTLRVSVDKGVTWSSLDIGLLDDPRLMPFAVWFQPRWLLNNRLDITYQEYLTGDYWVAWSDDDGASLVSAVSIMSSASFFQGYGMWRSPGDALFILTQDAATRQTHVSRSIDGTNDGIGWEDLGTVGSTFASLQGVAFMGDAMYLLNDKPELWRIDNPETSWSPVLVLDNTSPSPFGDGDTSQSNRDAMVAACPV